MPLEDVISHCSCQAKSSGEESNDYLSVGQSIGGSCSSSERKDCFGNVLPPEWVVSPEVRPIKCLALTEDPLVQINKMCESVIQCPPGYSTTGSLTTCGCSGIGNEGSRPPIGGQICPLTFDCPADGSSDSPCCGIQPSIAPVLKEFRLINGLP